MDSPYPVFECPPSGLVIVDGEVAALRIRQRAARPGEQRIAGAQVQGEASHQPVPLGAENDAALAQFVAYGIQVMAYAVLASGQPILGAVGDLQGHQVLAERIGTGANDSAESGRLVGPQLLARLIPATLAQAGQVSVPARAGQFEHALGAEQSGRVAGARR